MTGLVLRDVEVDGTAVDVAISGGRIEHVARGLPVPAGIDVVDGAGGALIPGLWDHHIHLAALAAARHSLVVGPPAVTDASQLAATLAGHRPVGPGAWTRGVGYHESVAGLLDRHDLDRLAPGAPLRIQHRSGALWILNSEAIRLLDIEDELRDGLERDPDGRLSGRLYGDDRWLRARMEAIGHRTAPDLAAVGRELAGYGVVGMTDMTPYERVADLDLLTGAARAGAIPQHVVVTGGPALAATAPPAPLRRGPVKLHLTDRALPSLDQLTAWITAAHDADRPVAVHCVTREALVLTLAALDDAGSAVGDRIEHGAVVPPELHAPLRRHGLTVVTQPNFVAERGEQYLTDVDSDDRPHLYPCASLLEAGIPVGGSTDAPFGHPDPWRAITAAVERRSDHSVVGAAERVPARRALDLFLGHPSDAGGPPRRVAPGAPADLCLLHPCLADVLAAPDAAAVRGTIIAGAVHGM